MLCACSIFFFSAFCLCLPDNMDILPRRRVLSRARSLLPERWRYPVEAAALGGAEDARARIGHARPLVGGDDAGAAFRPVPGVGGGKRAGSDRRQALQPVAARPRLPFGSCCRKSRAGIGTGLVVREACGMKACTTAAGQWNISQLAMSRGALLLIVP